MIRTSRNFVERHRVVMQDAALADLVAVDVEELDRVLAGQKFAFVELLESGKREAVEHDEAAEQHRQAFGSEFVEEPPPADELEAREIARPGVPVVLDARPRFAERRVDLRIES